MVCFDRMNRMVGADRMNRMDGVDRINRINRMDLRKLCAQRERQTPKVWSLFVEG